MEWWKIRQKSHSSWLIAVASLGVVVGVIGVQFIEQTILHDASILLTSLSIILTVLWRRSYYLIPLIFIGGILLGGWRGSIAQSALMPYQDVRGITLSLSGIVTEDVDIGKGGERVMRLKDIVIANNSVAGRVWVSAQTPADIKRGDVVTVQGKIQPGFGSFSAAIYRAQLDRVQRPEPGDVARQVRDSFADRIKQAIDEPQASLGIGYLVGQRRALPPELEESLRIAGLTHVVVASGYNLTILVRLARRLFVRLSKYLSLLAASGMIFSFIAVTGASPSMSRAGLVTGLSLLAWYYGRKIHPLVLLPLAAAVTLLVNPSYGWGDLGWQLSFAAFGGVMIMAPLLQAYFFGKEPPGTVRQILGETVSAQLCTLPLLVGSFGVISNAAIFANLLVLPLVPIAMLLTFTAGMAAWVVPGIATFTGMPAELLLRYMTSTASTLADLPWAQSELSLSAPGVVLGYAVIVGACWYMQYRTKYDLRKSNITE